MNFIEYIVCSNKEFYSAKPSDIRRAADLEVNCFGYDAKETFTKCNPIADRLSRMVRLAMFQVMYEANEQTWIDGRNKQSNKVLKAISYTDSFKEFYNNELRLMKPEEIQFYQDIAREIGSHTHRTILQQYASFVVYVLSVNDSIKSFLQEFRGSDDNFYKFCLI